MKARRQCCAQHLDSLGVLIRWATLKMVSGGHFGKQVGMHPADTSRPPQDSTLHAAIDYKKTSRRSRATATTVGGCVPMLAPRGGSTPARGKLHRNTKCALPRLQAAVILPPTTRALWRL